MQKLRHAAPLIRIMATDPSLRGLARRAHVCHPGRRRGRPSSCRGGAGTEYDRRRSGRHRVGDASDILVAGACGGSAPKPQDLRRFIDVWPVLDYRALQPGQAATAAVRRIATNAALKADFDASVGLTGPVPIADQEFASLRQGVWFNAAVTGGIILVVLWLALRSVRIVSAVVVTVLAGLLVTAALGLFLVGSFNPISVAFAFLFVGLGADFAIQFAVRYRAERHDTGDLRGSIIRAARYTGMRLLLAAAAAAAAFFVHADQLPGSGRTGIDCRGWDGNSIPYERHAAPGFTQSF